MNAASIMPAKVQRFPINAPFGDFPFLIFLAMKANGTRRSNTAMSGSVK
jgi:hypothetical protein